MLDGEALAAWTECNGVKGRGGTLRKRMIMWLGFLFEWACFAEEGVEGGLEGG